ncbi:MAG TPA: rhomboid family intramembrane serine protease [Thermoanaerobaculia bacterium]|nr:rhomboid family intramembrane serine protease [Thermoanaerobaculia bacterium]
MIPIRLAASAPREIPWVTRALCIALPLIFLLQFADARVGEMLIRVFGFVPGRLLEPELFGYTRLEALFTLVSSLFLHGGLVHLGGNIIYLWVFGGAVEAQVGSGRFVALYVLGGVAGSLVHAAVYPESTIASIGASGCIAAILGAFLILRPREPIVTLIPLVISWVLIEVPGIVFLPLWFGLQFLNGWLALRSAGGTEEIAGVAWWAHVGGFSLGMLFGSVTRWRSPKRSPAGR